MHIPSGCSKLENNIIIDKVKGLIFGGILGDSLGLATEGLSKSQIQQYYGQGPIKFGMDEDGVPFERDEYRSNFDENDFGNDTDQILILIESILENGGHFLQKDFSTRLKSLQKKSTLTNPVQQAEVCSNKEGGGGALVRAPLLGIIKFWDGTSVIENTTACCRITHPNPQCMISCVIASTLIARLMRGQDLEIQINPTTPIPSSSLLQHSKLFIDTLQSDTRLVSLVRNVVETNKPLLIAGDPLFITTTNQTDMAQMQSYYHQLLECSRLNEEDGLSAAIYCLTRHVPQGNETDYFKKMIMDVVMQGGQVTVVGALLGARFGYSQLPTEWVVGMKRWEWLEDKVDEFCNLL